MVSLRFNMLFLWLIRDLLPLSALLSFQESPSGSVAKNGFTHAAIFRPKIVGVHFPWVIDSVFVACVHP